MAFSLLQAGRRFVCGTFGSLLFARLAVGSGLALGVAAGATDAAEFARVAEELRNASRVEADLRTLCDGIGSRMAGTQGMRDALNWASQSLAKAGLINVRREAVPIPLLWQEGETRVEVIEPSAYRVRAVSSALSPAIRPGVEADLVYGGRGRPGFIARNGGRFRDKVLLVSLDEVGSFDDLAVEQRDAMIAFREAFEAGALAVLFISTRPNHLLYRHVNNIAGKLDEIPSALVAREDGLRMLRTLRAGAQVRVRIAMPNRIGSAYETANVVGDIPGDQLPEEIVLLGAHLDSWDLGTGCLDNAANVALVVNVARSIRASGIRSRRTLRFVLFGGEELGLFGSRAYVDRHGDELDGHVAAIVHDMGNGPLVGYSVGGREDLLPKLDAILEPMTGARELSHTTDAYFVSDNFTFVLQGVPSLFAVQDTAGFFQTYHSEADTYDKVRIAGVTESATVAAASMLGISKLDLRFGSRLSDRQVMDWMRSVGLVKHLRFLGVWEAWRLASDTEESRSK